MSIIARDLPNGDNPFEAAPPSLEYPFLNQGDSVSFIITRFFKQTIQGYNADRLAQKYTPGSPHEVDREHSGAYLINESAPSRTPTGLVAFSRSWAKVPLQQITPSSMFVTKPPISGEVPQNLGDSVIIQPDTTVANYNIYARNTVGADSGSPSGASIYPNGGNYSVTIDGATTANIAYDAASSAVKSALDAITPISDRGNATVTGTYNTIAGYSIVLSSIPVGTLDTSSLTVSSGGKTGAMVSDGFGGSAQHVQFNPTTGGATITGGTFTITIWGDTTAAIAYNATPSQVQTAINALASVNGHATVTIPSTSAFTTSILSTDATQIWFYVNYALPTGTTTSTNLTPTGSTANISFANLYNQYTLILRSGAIVSRVATTNSAHGISDSDNIYVKIGDSYVEIDSGDFSVTSTTSVTFTSDAEGVFTNSDTITEIGRRTSTYTAGAKLTRVKRITDYYLPGVTAGVNTVDDIPLPTWQGDPAGMLSAIFAGSTSINYEVGELGRWRDSPILFRTVTTLNAATL